MNNEDFLQVMGVVLWLRLFVLHFFCCLFYSSNAAI